MNNGDYIPLAQAVRDLRDASKDAGGNYDIMVFHDARKFRSIIKALEELKIFWCEVDGEIYVSRHEVYDMVGMK